jgi:ACS family tartrate transporter-like MFS transporter
MAPATADPTTTATADPIFRKLVRRLLLPLALLTFVNAIDRMNISFAAQAMSADVGLTPAMFGLGVSAFFVAYLIFQYPHALLLRVMGIRWWLLLSLSLWGVSGLWMAHVETAREFYAARFLLGMAEAGFAPGATWFIAQWVPVSARARAMAIALSAVPLSLVLGGPLCGWMLGLGTPFGMAEWRGMFLLQALPNFVLAVAAFFYFVDRPSQARWLTTDEKQKLTQLLAAESSAAATSSHWTAIAQDLQVWRCAVTWLLVMTGSYALVFWLPQLVRQLALADSEFLIGTLSALPQAALVAGLLLNARHSDRTGERLWHVGAGAALAGLALLTATLFPIGWPVLALLIVAGAGLGAAQGVFWTVPAALRIGGGRVPVGVIAFISMFGTAGGIIGPLLIGWIRETLDSFMPAIGALAVMLILAAFVIVARFRARSPQPVREA